MKKRIFSVSLTLLMLVVLALNAFAPAYAASAAEFEEVYQWNLSIFNTRSTDEEALKSFLVSRATIPSDNPDILELAESITKGKSSDYDKAKAIHSWVATNIWYDMDFAKRVESGESYSLYNFMKDRAAILDAIEDKRGVCSHYAFITVTLLRAIGIPAIVVDGYTDSGYSVSLKKYYSFISSNKQYAIHDWCEAYIGGKWIIIDTTWDSANIYENGRFSTQRSNYNSYFDVSIREFSKDHVYLMAYDAFVKDVELPKVANSVFPSAFNSCTRLENVVIPDSVTSIGKEAFLSCLRLESIALPDNVASIGESAFFNCRGLAEVTLPESLTSIEQLAFGYCENLLAITVPTGIKRLEDSVFAHCEGLSRVVLPESLESIGEYAFSFCWGLKTIDLPDRVVNIERYAFTYCHNLTSIVLPRNTRVLGDGAFATCQGLVIAYLPDGLVKIGKEAFRRCARLESVIIPASVTEIGSDAFDGCTRLTIYGKAGSYAETYARDNKIDFVAGSPMDTSAEWARGGISEAVRKGFVPGGLQNDYSKVITRAEFCRMAINWVEFATGKTIDAILDERGLSRDENAFTDTKDPDILAAYALGITSGMGNGLFSPNGEFSREQAATMVMNVCRVIGADTGNSPASGFADFDTAAQWARAGIDFVCENGIMQGTGNDNFSPKSVFTRQQSIITFNNIDPNAFVRVSNLTEGFTAVLRDAA